MTHKANRLFINGEWVASSSGETFEVRNPANGKVIALAAKGTREDTKRAIEAARYAFDEGGWGESKARDRAELLWKVADLIEARAEEFAQTDTRNNGKPLRESRYDVTDAVNQFRYYAGLCTKPQGQTYDVPDEIQAMVVREPIGVVGAITCWNYPLVMNAQKVAPALAAGNTLVLKPADLTPLTTIMLFECLEQAGFPPGVVNLVTGPGSVVGDEISRNELVDKVAFTGGTETGIAIMKNAADTVKKLSLELGGKSPNIVFADADFETAVDYALFAIFANQGEVCSAGSRLILEESIYEPFVARLVERAQKIVVGDGADPETEMGPLISAEHMERVLSYIQLGRDEGAQLLCGGNRLTDQGRENGYYIDPTIFAADRNDLRIVQEEIFGPVLVVQKFSTEQEAIRLANSTKYGLAGAVFTSDGAKAQRVIRKLRAGITWINTYHPTFNEAPWGGYKMSGIGRELGTFGYEAYTEVKQINVNLQVQPSGWFRN
ncbi:aldehyde dehydrogenase family protein [Brevibacillus invocatus]|uniref:aldehyde dehydrogenase family protein n=1 Tax=Brevibacillus invocatus TaxID=173959 RepID=UPI00203B968A|nr:aldehyde dehydrogenase family protein [Brevibacillus invocatus]MCM3081156.1 aldehyde dehydrogenase family protein [Brevibacillus invocatus]MCM3431447.1 aldehyde dehydrogenase family protein [Brevibacillus invocatus]